MTFSYSHPTKTLHHFWAWKSHINVSRLHKIRRKAGFAALNLWNVRSGVLSHRHMLIASWIILSVTFWCLPWYLSAKLCQLWIFLLSLLCESTTNKYYFSINLFKDNTRVYVNPMDLELQHFKLRMLCHLPELSYGWGNTFLKEAPQSKCKQNARRRWLSNFCPSLYSKLEQKRKLPSTFEKQ